MEATEEHQQLVRPYRELSVDGGGIQGSYSAGFLARLTDQVAQIRGQVALDFDLGFDLVTGTSTGAIPNTGRQRATNGE